MAYPELIGGGSTLCDTQRVYTDYSLRIGTVGVLNGRSYVWCSYTGSTALVRGEPLVSAQIGNEQNLACTTNCLGVGMKTITGITAGIDAITANQFQDGLMVVVDGGGEGNAYQIQRHSAFTASTADGTIVLYEPVEVASDANTEITLIRNKYASVQRARGAMRDPFVGVPNMAVPAGDSTTQYFWAQRVGLCPAFVKGTPKHGESIVLARNEPGRFAAATTQIEVVETGSAGRSVHQLDPTPVVGQMASNAIDGEVQIVDLQNPMF